MLFTIVDQKFNVEPLSMSMGNINVYPYFTDYVPRDNYMNWTDGSTVPSDVLNGGPDIEPGIPLWGNGKHNSQNLAYGSTCGSHDSLYYVIEICHRGIMSNHHSAQCEIEFYFICEHY